MKLTITLTEPFRAQLETHRATLAGLIQDREKLREDLNGLLAIEAALPAEMADLEQRAKSGLDAQAAIDLAGKREQARLLRANIEQTSQRRTGELLQNLRAGVVQAYAALHRVGLIEIGNLREQITGLLTPYCENAASAEQFAKQLPAFQYLCSHFGREGHYGAANLNIDQAADEALSRIQQLTAMLNGKDFLPDYGEVMEAKRRGDESFRQRRQAAGALH